MMPAKKGWLWFFLFSGIFFLIWGLAPETAAAGLVGLGGWGTAFCWQRLAQHCRPIAPTVTVIAPRRITRISADALLPGDRLWLTAGDRIPAASILRGSFFLTAGFSLETATKKSASMRLLPGEQLYTGWGIAEVLSFPPAAASPPPAPTQELLIPPAGIVIGGMFSLLLLLRYGADGGWLLLSLLAVGFGWWSLLDWFSSPDYAAFSLRRRGISLEGGLTPDDWIAETQLPLSPEVLSPPAGLSQLITESGIHPHFPDAPAALDATVGRAYFLLGFCHRVRVLPRQFAPCGGERGGTRIEQLLLAAARAQGVPGYDFSPLGESPWQASESVRAVWGLSAEGEHLLLAAGDPKELLGHATALLTAAGSVPLSDAKRKSWQETATYYEAEGHIVVGLAYRLQRDAQDTAVSSLIWVGLAVLATAPRPASLLEELRQTGAVPDLSSADSALCTAAVADTTTPRAQSSPSSRLLLTEHGGRLVTAHGNGSCSIRGDSLEGILRLRQTLIAVQNVLHNALALLCILLVGILLPLTLTAVMGWQAMVSPGSAARLGGLLPALWMAMAAAPATERVEGTPLVGVLAALAALGGFWTAPILDAAPITAVGMAFATLSIFLLITVTGWVVRTAAPLDAPWCYSILGGIALWLGLELGGTGTLALPLPLLLGAVGMGLGLAMIGSQASRNIKKSAPAERIKAKTVVDSAEK